MESERFNCNVNYSKFCVDDEVPLTCNGISRPRRFPFRIATSDLYNAASVGSIHHPVSKFDTLAGVAIKYGVEVADIKKMNGLVSDLQMFAHKSIQIPLPGRHPPSPGVSNSSDTPRNEDPDTSDSFQSFKLCSPKPKVSPAMSSLQGYYGLESGSSSVYSPSVTSSGLHRKSRSLVECFIDDKSILVESGDDVEKRDEKLLRRRQKSEADFSKNYVNIPIWDDTTAASSTAITGKNLAQRSKALNRAETGFCPAAPNGIWESLESGGCSSSVRRSSSTSNLHDQDSNSSSLWSTSMWNLRPDLQAFSQATMARPIFDGLPKPSTIRRNKAALD